MMVYVSVSKLGLLKVTCNNKEHNFSIHPPLKHCTHPTITNQ